MKLTKGARVRTYVECNDADEHDRPRVTPVGTYGTVTLIDRRETGPIFHVEFENGAFVPFTEHEAQMLVRVKPDQESAVKRLRELLHPGDTVHTILRHVSQSGMMRHVSALLLPKEGETRPFYLDGLAADALDWKLAEREGVKVGGCGMDMGFHLVYSLSRVLFPNGYECIGERCPANDHFNARRSHCPVCGTELQVGVHLFKERQGDADGPYMRGLYDAKGIKTSGRNAHVVCSERCARDPWRHNDGGYAINQAWL